LGAGRREVDSLESQPRIAGAIPDADDDLAKGDGRLGPGQEIAL
jgi:hypothetical protein